MYDLDGSAGGGQLVRSALTLSVLTGEAFRMSEIRGARPNPGLRPQHLAAVGVAAAVCDADVTGAAVDADELAFEPGTLRGGTVDVDVGTAGSVTLVFDVVLPLALALPEPLVVTATGGTDVAWSPTAAYYRRVKLPLLGERGLHASLDVDRPGFYPVGGGEARLSVAPSTLERFASTERGALEGYRVHSTASMDLSGADVADRQADAAIDVLESTGASVVERTVTYAAADSPGSALAVRADYDESLAGFDALGERGKPAEDVGEEAAEAALAFEGGRAAVDEHAADQVLVFLALAGGRVAVPRVTDHVLTSLDLLDTFGFDVRVDETPTGPVLVGDG
ncbi:MAG: RNA 3'-terminal phosphate cyclase [Salinigranum sp.]